jgi:hypothetical protein
MTRIKSPTFVGVRVADTDPDAASFHRGVVAAIGDTALAYDKLTGRNGEAGTIVRDGTPGRGARLGMPLVNQWVGKNMVFTGAFASALTYVVAMPLFIPPGEDSITVVLVADATDDDRRPRCYLRSVAAFAANGDNHVEMEPVRNLGSGRKLWVATITGITAGLSLFFIDKIIGGFDWFVESLSVHHNRVNAEVGPPTRQAASTIGVTVPGATQGLSHVDFDDSLVGGVLDLHALNGYITTYLNRNQNALEEYLTGWPAGGNAAYSHVDHDGAGAPDSTNPARSRFHAHARNVEASEGEIAFPVWAECFGGCLAAPGFAVTPAEPPTVGLLEWYAPWVKAAVTAVRTVRSSLGVFPDFQTSSSTLKMAILAVTEQSAPGDINNFDGSCGETTLEGTGTFGTVPNTGTAGSTPMLALAQASGLSFSPDQVDRLIRTRVTCTSSRKGITDLAILGACLYFEP